ncbi:hemolysin family protein [Stackebrandtia nassauensis]|uniref:CBS domain containing protein n=1 Tax=Stackebrandtia nassauensis (strain DSM 44728 / CIP 108903 / NRRL B-16338 / NBRC 102104 / LLR-40K-21) TaxID=446470 RepID=D3Q6M5_STANL|nr:hemolysin family protein [Stackebrandtia nassauensis]ADD44268.1 CBS domain containing protein [Stackebrandtia nassauensis DSM 44728]
MSSYYMLLGIAAALVVMAGLAAMTDAALSRVSPARVEELVRDRQRGAVSLKKVVADIPRYINLLMLLRLACELTATTLVAVAAFRAWDIGWAATAITAAAMTIVSFVLIGVGPRTLGRQHAYPVALASAGIVHWLGRALGPLPKLLILIGNAVTPGKGFREGPFATQTELRELVDIAEQRGEVEHGEREMINSVFALGNTIAREVMVPRTETVWVESSKSAKQALALALRSGFSRIPVIGDDVDDVSGVVYLKDLVRLTGEGADPKVSEVMRDVTFVPESKPVDDLLREMQAARIHIGVVVDEYGGTAGVITIEDILEEIVGEITDEYDVERPTVEALPDGAHRVTARMSIEDLSELCGVDIEPGDVETVAGLLAQALGKVPIPGAHATIHGLDLTAEGTAGRRNRIDTVVVRRIADQPDEEEENH